MKQLLIVINASFNHCYLFWGIRSFHQFYDWQHISILFYSVWYLTCGTCCSVFLVYIPCGIVIDLVVFLSLRRTNCAFYTFGPAGRGLDIAGLAWNHRHM